MQAFKITISDEIIADLKDRLRRTRWPEDLGNDDWGYGVNAHYLRDLVTYWIEAFDWRRQEQEINRYEHFRVVLDDVPIHFLRRRGRGPAPIPLILTHGWPWSFWDFRQVIDPLADPAAHGGAAADAFEVIVPSLPGFGFSTPLKSTGMNFWRTADLWHRLMKETLGYAKYAAHGGDWGAMVTSQLAHKYAEHLIGIHVSAPMRLDVFGSQRPWDLLGPYISHLSVEQAKQAVEVERRLASHVTTHILDPQTLAYGLHDSPVGLLAWLLERRRAWSDCGGDLQSRFSRDDLLTCATIYWATESFVTSARYYSEAARHPWTPEHDRSPMFEAPAGVSLFAKDGAGLFGSAMLANYNMHHLAEHASGGHFAAAEEPVAIVTDIRDTFRTLRPRSGADPQPLSG
jgi:pimeloyl-ACP methyl ester carboxylesterase